MNNPWSKSPRVSRRKAIKLGMVPVAGAALSPWLMAGCSVDGRSPFFPGFGTNGNRGGAVPGGALLGTGGSTWAGGEGAWALGGTQAMAGGYPDPFLEAPQTACVLLPAQTVGPCYADTLRREDISDGLPGVPIRMSFLVVRANTCSPVSNAEVDIWHAGSNGIYSAYARGTICNPGRDDVRQETFCRGIANTDSDGRVDFSTVFPGWYTGRTIHIHLTVRVGGVSYITSQLYFDDALNDELLSLPLYAERGRRDTTNATDGILRASEPAKVMFSVAQRPDGALHAWKVIAIRS